MPSAYIVDAARTAGGKKNGALSGWHPIDLGAAVLDGLLEKLKITGNAHQIDDVIFGCLSTVGPQSGNIGRQCVLASKHIPEAVPGVTIDRQCGSSQQAVHFAAQAVMSGTQDIVIAGGVENMSMCNIGCNVTDSIKRGLPFSEGLRQKYGDSLNQFDEFKVPKAMFTQFGGSELLSKKYSITRSELDNFAALSQQRAAAATKAGKFTLEIVPLKERRKKGEEITESGKLHLSDEGVREGVTRESVGKLKPLHHNGVISVASSSQICDGASAVLICNEIGLRKLGLSPRAQIVQMAVCGSDPVIMLEGPIPATKKVLSEANMTIEQFDCYEVNEAFGCVPLAWCKALKADLDRLNKFGGAQALGHPIGATGTKLMCTLLNVLEDCKGQYGLLAICEGGGTANATIIKSLKFAQSKL